MATNVIKLTDSPAVSVRKITKALTAHAFNKHNSNLAWFPLSELVDAVGELRSFCEDPIFGQEFLTQGGLSLVMKVIANGRLEFRKIVTVAYRMLKSLEDIEVSHAVRRRSHVPAFHIVYQDALEALPRLISCLGDIEETKPYQLECICLINILLEMASGKSRSDMIKKLVDKSSEHELKVLRMKERDIMEHLYLDKLMKNKCFV